MEKRKPKKTFIDYMLSVILLVSIGVFCFAGARLFEIYLEYKEGKDEYDQIAQMVVNVREPDVILNEPATEPNDVELNDIESNVELKEDLMAKVSDSIVLEEELYKEVSEWKELPIKKIQINNKYLQLVRNTKINPLMNKWINKYVTNIRDVVLFLDQKIKNVLLDAKYIQAPIEIDFKMLKEINEDVIGWIYVEAIDTINYPVVKGDDNDEYLHHTYEKNYNFAGTIFIEHENSSDFTDANTIVYGHNMKNGSMFGQLKNFVNKKELYEQSKYFWILTPDADYRYEIISAYTTGITSETYTLFFETREDFIDYIEKIRNWSEIPVTEKRYSRHNKVVTLSTCTGNDATRFIVQGVRVNTIIKKKDI